MTQALVSQLKNFNNDIQAIIGLQTDDTPLACNTVFKDKEQEELEKAQFPAKPLQNLTVNSSLEFNGMTLTKSPEGSITISQSFHTEKITLVDTDNPT
jgi:hypothetical protein